MRKYVYDYYLVDIPGDAFQSYADAQSQAITEARERTRLHCSPCEWWSETISGAIGDNNIVVKVTRKRLHRVKASKT